MSPIPIVFQRNGDVGVGLTYMTGTLVKTGQRIAAALTGGDRWKLWKRLDTKLDCETTTSKWHKIEQSIQISRYCAKFHHRNRYGHKENPRYRVGF
jgi:uncharacterized membrane protein YoaK (UPF0700 family)